MLKRWLLVPVLALAVLAAGAAAEEPVQDVDYVLIDPQPVMPGKIEVIEFFYYGCESCNRLEPRLQSWMAGLADDVSFRRVPAIRRTAWVPLTRLYFALDQLGEIDRLHAQVYRAVHGAGLNPSDVPALEAWAREHGLDAGKLEQLMDSDAIRDRVQRAHDETVAYGVRATPSFVVDGKYLTEAGMAGSADALLGIVDGLVDKARASRGQRR
ncbi:MAG TPA: thiol:disulfide interchange protein DsbA/DsbL [Burkholderiales bacterium]|nr:thiol:disulfide interchange protein DsbA/DsbL [Burkholderiales bacterium]